MSWRDTAARLKREVFTLYFAVRDPRVPWYTKTLAGSIVAYACSPIDLIPDFIPVLGYLDDLLILPLAIALVIRLIPRDTWEDCHRRVTTRHRETRRAQLAGAAIVVGIWLLVFVVVVFRLVRW